MHGGEGLRCAVHPFLCDLITHGHASLQRWVTPINQEQPEALTKMRPSSSIFMSPKSDARS